MSKGRSRTIARTETMNATRTTTDTTATEAGMEYKEWIHTDAGKTQRENHVALDGVKVKINEYFDLGGGVLALYPHDPTLPAEELINCYCIVIYE